MPDTPTGTVTIVFTDIEGSTRLLYALGDEYADALATHRAIIRAACGAHGGVEVETEGDAFFLLFPRAGAAVAAAVDAQRDLAAHSWPAGADVRVRMALHTGEPRLTAEGYVGIDLHRAARIRDAGHGGQILLSRETAGLVEQSLPQGVELRRLGEFRLKDLAAPELIHQLEIEGLPAHFPALRASPARVAALPVPPTPIVGRAQAIEEVVRLLRRGDARLVTLTGPGGAGKTRLAWAVAERAQRSFRDGVAFVPLASIASAELVATAIAQALGLRALSGRSIEEALREHLRDKAMLLLLDNFEHVLDAAPLVADLLGDCARLRILATSRAPLRLAGEQDLPVRPLAVPDLREAATARTLADNPAVALFVQRARAVRPDFALTDENAAAVAQICRRLDGLPLAIVLAAARVNLFRPAALLARLDRPLPFLTQGNRDLPERHRTLRDTIRWSYDLLGPVERVMFRRLSVFAGGCTIAAAEAICATPDTLVPDALAALDALVDGSLLQAESDPDGEPRFRMLETVREFAAELLEEAGESSVLRAAHIRWLRALTRPALSGFVEIDQLTWLRRAEVEIDNVRAALTWALTEPDAIQDGLALAGGLAPLWVQAHLREGCDWLVRLLAADTAPGRTVRANALFIVAQLLVYRSGFIAARPYAQECVDLGRAIGRPAFVIQGLGLLALADRGIGDAARRAADEAVVLARQGGEPALLLRALFTLGAVACWEGDLDLAQEACEEAVSWGRRSGIYHLIAAPLRDLGNVAYRRREFATARRYMQQSLDLLRELGSEVYVVQTLGSLGRVARAEGKLDEAVDHYHAMWEIGRDTGSIVDLPLAPAGLAWVALDRGRPERAANLLGAAEALGEAMGVPMGDLYRDEHVELTAALRARLGEERVAALWAEGRALTLDQVFEPEAEEVSCAR